MPHLDAMSARPAAGDSGDLMREMLLRFAEDQEWMASVATQITEAVHAELPELDDAVEDARRGTFRHAEAVLRLMVDMLRSGLEPREAKPPPAAVDAARELARHGVGLQTLLRIYHVGHGTFFGMWVDRLRASLDDPAELALAIEQSARWLFAYIDVLSTGVAQRHEDERERWFRSAAAIREETVRAIVAGETGDVQRLGRRLGYPLDGWHVAFLVWSDPRQEASGTARVMVERAAGELAGPLGTPLLVPLGPLLVAGWAGTGREADESQLTGLRLGAEAYPGVLAAFGGPGAGVEGFRRSHREAMHARRVAQIVGGRSGSVTHYDKVALLALATADLDHAREFARRELGALASDDDTTRRLAATVQVYLEEWASPRRTAHRLGIHENTVANRMRTAEKLLGRPIDARPCELEVALRLARLIRG